MLTTESPAFRLATALAIGLLMGAERERRKGAGPGRSPAGIRTFAVAALLGGVSYRQGAAGCVYRAHSLQQDFGKTFYGRLRWGGYPQDGNVHSILTTDLGMLPFANIQHP